MKVAVFGGSGATGKKVIAALLDAGMPVRALSRRPEGLESRPGLEAIVGSLSDARVIEATLRGTDAVCCLFGPRPPYRDIFCAEATTAIVAAMRRLGMRRIICQTGAMIGDYPANRSWAMRKMTSLFNRSHPELARDRCEQEGIVMASGLDWTIIKPPRLTDRQSGQGLKVGRDVHIGMLSAVSRNDIAAWLITELRQPGYIGEAVFIRR